MSKLHQVREEMDRAVIPIGFRCVEVEMTFGGPEPDQFHARFRAMTWMERENFYNGEDPGDPNIIDVEAVEEVDGDERILRGVLPQLASGG